MAWHDLKVELLRKSEKNWGQLVEVKLFPSVSNALGNAASADVDEDERLTVVSDHSRRDPSSAIKMSTSVSLTLALAFDRLCHPSRGMGGGYRRSALISSHRATLFVSATSDGSVEFSKAQTIEEQQLRMIRNSKVSDQPRCRGRVQHPDRAMSEESNHCKRTWFTLKALFSCDKKRAYFVLDEAKEGKRIEAVRQA